MEGNINLILTAPHGGREKNLDCEKRTPGCKINNRCNYDSIYTQTCTENGNEICKVVTKSDFNTDIIAEDLVKFLKPLLGGTPHLIIMREHRSKIDANREINEACMKW